MNEDKMKGQPLKGTLIASAIIVVVATVVTCSVVTWLALRTGNESEQTQPIPPSSFIPVTSISKRTGTAFNKRLLELNESGEESDSGQKKSGETRSGSKRTEPDSVRIPDFEGRSKIYKDSYEIFMEMQKKLGFTTDGAKSNEGGRRIVKKEIEARSDNRFNDFDMNPEDAYLMDPSSERPTSKSVEQITNVQTAKDPVFRKSNEIDFSRPVWDLGRIFNTNDQELETNERQDEATSAESRDIPSLVASFNSVPVSGRTPTDLSKVAKKDDVAGQKTAHSLFEEFAKKRKFLPALVINEDTGEREPTVWRNTEEEKETIDKNKLKPKGSKDQIKEEIETTDDDEIEYQSNQDFNQNMERGRPETKLTMSTDVLPPKDLFNESYTQKIEKGSVKTKVDEETEVRVRNKTKKAQRKSSEETGHSIKKKIIESLDHEEPSNESRTQTTKIMSQSTKQPYRTATGLPSFEDVKRLLGGKAEDSSEVDRLRFRASTSTSSPLPVLDDVEDHLLKVGRASSSPEKSLVVEPESPTSEESYSFSTSSSRSTSRSRSSTSSKRTTTKRPRSTSERTKTTFGTKYALEDFRLADSSAVGSKLGEVAVKIAPIAVVPYSDYKDDSDFGYKVAPTSRAKVRNQPSSYPMPSSTVHAYDYNARLSDHPQPMRGKRRKGTLTPSTADHRLAAQFELNRDSDEGYDSFYDEEEVPEYKPKGSKVASRPDVRSRYKEPLEIGSTDDLRLNDDLTFEVLNKFTKTVAETWKELAVTPTMKYRTNEAYEDDTRVSDPNRTMYKADEHLQRTNSQNRSEPRDHQTDTPDHGRSPLRKTSNEQPSLPKYSNSAERPVMTHTETDPKEWLDSTGSYPKKKNKDQTRPVHFISNEYPVYDDSEVRLEGDLDNQYDDVVMKTNLPSQKMDRLGLMTFSAEDAIEVQMNTGFNFQKPGSALSILSAGTASPSGHRDPLGSTEKIQRRLPPDTIPRAPVSAEYIKAQADTWMPGTLLPTAYEAIRSPKFQPKSIDEERSSLTPGSLENVQPERTPNLAGTKLVSDPNNVNNGKVDIMTAGGATFSYNTKIGRSGTDPLEENGSVIQGRRINSKSSSGTLDPNRRHSA